MKGGFKEGEFRHLLTPHYIYYAKLLEPRILKESSRSLHLISSSPGSVRFRSSAPNTCHCDENHW